MYMKKIIAIILLSILVGLRSFSKEINLPFNLTISVPESVIQDTTSRYLFLAYDSTFSVYVSTVETSDFHSGEVLRTVEQYSYNIQNMNIHCYRKEKDKFYEWNKDYVKKYYKGTDINFLTYTFYTTDRPYSILVGYKGQKGEKEAEAVIQSIRYNGNLWKQICLVYKRATLFWWLFYGLLYPAICLCVMVIFSNYDDDIKIKKPYIISVICTIPILLLTLWGSWVSIICYLLINIIATVPCFILGMIGMESIFKKDDKSKNKNDNYSDYDGGEYKTEYAEMIGL